MPKKKAKSTRAKSKPATKKSVAKKTVVRSKKTARATGPKYLMPLVVTFAGLSVLMALMVMYEYYFVL